MKLSVEDYHSYVPDLLSGRPILDVGARGFKFANAFARRGHRVVAMDPDPSIAAEAEQHLEGFEFLVAALVGCDPGPRSLVVTANPEARFVKPVAGFQAGASQQYTRDPIVEIDSYTIAQVMTELDIQYWDLVKLNCEGEEAEILKRWPGPIAGQIVVSFHEHYRPIGEEAIASIVEHLNQWYKPIRHIKDERYGGGPNYWDSVFALRSLVENQG